MGLKVGYEVQSNGNWGMMELKNNNASHLKAIVVGNRDFLMTGTQRQMVKWLASIDMPVKCSPGFGKEVWIILREVSPKVNEELNKAYGALLGPGGPGSTVYHGFAAFSPAANTFAQSAPSGAFAADVASVAFNWSGKSLDDMLMKVFDKLRGKKITVRLSSAKGAYGAKFARSSTVKMGSNYSSRVCAGVISTLSW